MFLILVGVRDLGLLSGFGSNAISQHLHRQQEPSNLVDGQPGSFYESSMGYRMRICL